MNKILEQKLTYLSRRIDVEFTTRYSRGQAVSQELGDACYCNVRAALQVGGVRLMKAIQTWRQFLLEFTDVYDAELNFLAQMVWMEAKAVVAIDEYYFKHRGDTFMMHWHTVQGALENNSLISDQTLEAMNRDCGKLKKSTEHEVSVDMVDRQLSVFYTGEPEDYVLAEYTNWHATFEVRAGSKLGTAYIIEKVKRL